LTIGNHGKIDHYWRGSDRSHLCSHQYEYRSVCTIFERNISICRWLCRRFGPIDVSSWHTIYVCTLMCLRYVRNRSSGHEWEYTQFCTWFALGCELRVIGHSCTDKWWSTILRLSYF
jgi:hypothetical protein